MTTENQVPPTIVQVSLFHITKPEAWRIDYWSSFCRTVRRGQKVVLTNSHESKEALKRIAADELALLGQVASFVEEAQP